ncbi:MAG TPA: hypothetical protein DDY25_05905 [Peptococcaceae bacterium]|nr:hypothetical protein [Peptococcaceae bacterium]
MFDKEQMEELREELQQMSKEDLRVKVAELRGDLAEMEEQTMFLLRSTGHHIGGVDRRKREKSIKQLEELVQFAERELLKR